MSSRDQLITPDVWWSHFVSYGETDAMGVVYYGNYLHWFEQARNNFIRAFGCSYSQIEEKGIFLPVREAFCRYRHPAKFDQKISIRTRISKWGRASLTFDYQIYNQINESQIITSGYTLHACTNSQGKPVAVPEWLRQMFVLEKKV